MVPREAQHWSRHLRADILRDWNIPRLRSPQSDARQARLHVTRWAGLPICWSLHGVFMWHSTCNVAISGTHGEVGRMCVRHMSVLAQAWSFFPGSGSRLPLPVAPQWEKPCHAFLYSQVTWFAELLNCMMIAFLSVILNSSQHQNTGMKQSKTMDRVNKEKIDAWRNRLSEQ